MKTVRRMLRRLARIFKPHDVVPVISRMPVGLELSDGDRAALYGWPGCRVEEVGHADS